MTLTPFFAEVTSISPNNGPEAGGTPVTITGGVFTADCVVDFGTVPAVVISISSSQITAIQPPGTGTVDVRVTNLYGTSAAKSVDQFAAPPPVAPTVSSVSPSGGPTVSAEGSTYTVTVTGTGFVIPSNDGYVVNFGPDNAGTDVKAISLTELTVTPPSTGSGTVDVQVTIGLVTSTAAPPGDQFAFGTPIVMGVSPSSGPAAGGTEITITGYGFAAGCSVQFVNTTTNASKAGSGVTVVSDTSITVTSPKVTLVGGGYNETLDVTVTNQAGQVSAITPDDEYMYYPS